MSTLVIPRAPETRRRRPLKRKAKLALAKRVREMQKYHRVVCVFLPRETLWDEDLEILAKCDATGSGTDLQTGVRDIDFEFTSLATAQSAAKRIKAARLPGVRVLIDGLRSA